MKLKNLIKYYIFGSWPGKISFFPYFRTKVFFPKGSYLFKIACQQGVYELDNILLLKNIVKNNSVFFDVGANIGLMAIPILDELNQCQVVSFEPSPLSFSCLSRTARESRFRDRWKVVGKALGRQEGDLEFCTSSDGFDAFNGFKNTKRVDSKESIIVSVSTLDGEWEKMGNPHVSAIKIDVEGAEMEVLSGALLCINHERPAILVEWNLLNITPYNLLPSSLLEFTRSINYNLYSVPMMVPIKDETMLNVSMLKTESFLLFPCKN